MFAESCLMLVFNEPNLEKGCQQVDMTHTTQSQVRLCAAFLQPKLGRPAPASLKQRALVVGLQKPRGRYPVVAQTLRLEFLAHHLPAFPQQEIAPDFAAASLRASPARRRQPCTAIMPRRRRPAVRTPTSGRKANAGSSALLRCPRCC